MSKYDWIIGIDLGQNEAQISIDDEEKSAALPEHIPIALYPSVDGETWLAGSEAMAAAFDGGGLVEGFVSAGEDTQYAGGYGRRELIRIYLCALLDIAGVPRDAYERTALTVTLQDPDESLVLTLLEIGKELFPDAGSFTVISHTMAYEYYTIAQKKELWARDVGMFEYDHEGLRYHHLTVSSQAPGGYLAAETTGLQDIMDGSEIGRLDEKEMDLKFSEAMGRAVNGKQISTFYLVGEGFEENEDGRLWLNQSLQKLCAYRRHVFVGQNLYARGACMCSHFTAYPQERPNLMLFDNKVAPKEIYMLTLFQRKAVKTVLLPAGNAWYNAAGSLHLLIGSTDHLVFRIRDVMSGAEKRVLLELPDLPVRPGRTTQLAVRACFVSEKVCRITVSDEGFGEFFAASGKQWETSFDIEAPDTADEEAKEDGFVIETAKVLNRDVLVMPVTGVRIGGIEQLCWYIYTNTDILNADMYNERLFDWLSSVTGDPSIADYVRSGRTCKEMTRRLLTTANYFSGNEINAVIDRMIRMEKMPAADREKLAADTWMRNGLYLTALRQYHHLSCHMADAPEEKQAAIWRNMGLASFKLHNKVQAADCMKKARDVSGQEQDQTDYLLMLLACGFSERFEEEAGKAELTEEQMEELAGRVRRVQDAFEFSERGQKVRDGIELKHVRRMADYSDFVQSFVDSRQERYMNIKQRG